MKYYKTVITIYTDYLPESNIEYLAREATSGDAVCTSVESVQVERADVPEAVLSFNNDLDGAE